MDTTISKMKERGMNTKISKKEKLSYAIGSGGGNIITTIFGSFLTAYYTDTVGLAAAAIGTMMLLSRVVDGISDIIIGGFVDKTKTRWGKARPWLLFTAPLTAIMLILLFMVPDSFSNSSKLIYAYITYILDCVVFTAFMIAHSSLMARITYDSNERHVMSAMNQIVNNVFALIVASVTMPLVASIGWRNTAAIYGVVAATMIFIAFLGTREHLGMEEGSEEVHLEDVPLKEAIPALIKNKYFYLITAVFTIILIIVAGTGSATYFYCSVILKDISMLTPISIAGMVPLVVANFFLPAVIKRIGSHKCMIFSALLIVIGFSVIGLAGSNVTLVLIGSAVKGFGMAPIFTCGFVLIAQVVDYGDWKYNIRSEGLINSCISFGQKIGLGLGAAISTWILAAGGYIGTAAVQTESAELAIKFAFGYFGAISGIILLGVCLFINIDKYSDKIKKELEARKASK